MEQEIAKVALSAATYAIDRPYDYRVPAGLTGLVKPGMRVMVPFGAGNRKTDGIVLSLGTRVPQGVRLKEIAAVLDDTPMLDEEELQLALWLRERYFCTVYEAARAMLPAGLWFSIKDCWHLSDGVDREAAFAAAGNSKNERHLIELLFANEGSAEMEQIRLAFGEKDPNPALKELADRGIIRLVTSAERNVGDKTEQVAVLTADPEEAMSAVSGRRSRAPLQYAVLEQLCALGSVAAKELCYFTGASMTTLRALEKKGFLALEKREVLRRTELLDVEPAGPLVLNAEQQAAADGMKELLRERKPAVSLLYGVTGSGKTQVYLSLIHEVLEQGRTALVMVPEIALTPQVLRLFTAHFGAQVAVFHSSLSTGERYDEWKRVRRGEARVVVGTRSAVFAPLRDLGVLIVDEEQEPTYKSEQVPRYHARDVAKYRCAKSGCLLVLGSATPAVESMYQTEIGNYHLFRLEQRYNEQALPDVQIVDMKQELRTGNGGDISAPLRRALEEQLEKGEQSILFINRRGASRMVTCGECGEVPSCPRCSVKLTYHSANRRLMCHYCGYSEPLPEECPQCGGMLTFIGTGTQKVQEELEELFPGVEIMRMDTDTVTATRSHEAMLSRFRKERVPILVGTQMVAKGLDFENVTLVGVIAADLSLFVEDFHAGERTFSLLTQVVGRAGRGDKTGRAVIQTWTPQNEVILCAARQDYDAFYAQEILMRRARDEAPFSDRFVLTASGLEESSVLRACARLRDALREVLESGERYRGVSYRLLGPAPAAVAKVNNRYRYHISLICQNQKLIRDLLAHLVRQAQKDKINRGVSVFVDCNPLD